MRIKIMLSGTDSELPSNNQYIINSFIHRALGKNNEYHDVESNYCVSILRGGKLIKGTEKISFKNGGYITISSFDGEFLNKIMIGAYDVPFYNKH